MRALMLLGCRRQVLFYILPLLALCACVAFPGGALPGPAGDAAAVPRATPTAIAAAPAATLAPGMRPSPTITSTPAPSPSASPSPTVAPTSPPPTAAPTSVPPPLDAEALLAQAAPSIVRVAGQQTVGTGFVIDGGYALTAAHVIYPQSQALVLFPGGGQEFAPVHSVDLLADLAVIGPLRTAAPPLPLAAGGPLRPGDEVAAVGYAFAPASNDGRGDLAVLPGTVRGRIPSPALGLTFYQTDIAPTPGNSGSPLLNTAGEVAGLINIAAGQELGFLAPAMTALRPRLELALEGHGAATLAMDRREHHRPAAVFLPYAVSGADYGLVAILPAPAPGPWELALARPGDDIVVLDAHGDYVATTLQSGAGALTIDNTSQAPYFTFVLGEASGRAGVLSSNWPLARFDDPDDGTFLPLGETRLAAIDHPLDVDRFTVRLAAGQRVTIEVASFMLDPQALIYPQTGRPLLGRDDDSGGGLVGLDAALTYQAPAAGYYTIVVESATWGGAGAYALRVNQAAAGASPAPLLTRDDVWGRLETEVGLMEILYSLDGRLRLPVPDGLDKVVARHPTLGIDCRPPHTVCVADDATLLAIAAESPPQPAGDAITLNAWAEAAAAAFESRRDVQLESLAWLPTNAGELPLLEVVAGLPGGERLRLRQLRLAGESSGYVISVLTRLDDDGDRALRERILYALANVELVQQGD